MKLDIYTAHHTDNKHGASFNAVITVDGNIDDKQFNLYGADDTYQTIFIKGTGETLAFLKNLPFVQDLHITLHTAHSNITKLMKRIEDVFDNVRKYNNVGTSQIRQLIDMKLRRGNRSKFDQHEELVEIVMSLMAFHYKYASNFSFRVLNTYKHEQMRDAYQWAKINHENQVAQAGSDSNVIQLRAAA